MYVHKWGGAEYIECTYIERGKFKLEADMAEIYKTSVLRQYEFPVWPDETFTPEAVVWDRIALDGYRIRYYDEKIYVCEYLEDGLTKGGNRLYYHNLMGCAMALNAKLSHTKGFRNRWHLIREILICCYLKHDLSYVPEICSPTLAYAMLPVAFIYYLRRRRLFAGL